MIYLVSNRIDAAGLQDIRAATVDESIRLIESWPVVQFDTETTGLDCHVNKLTSLQFGYKDFKTGETTAIVVDCESIEPEQFKDIIEKSMLVGHNLKFDLEFLYNHRIVPLRLYDTMICEKTLYLGYSPKQVSCSLGSVLQRYTGIELDKSYQSVIASKGLTKEGIIYAAHDVMYLQDIRKSQIEIAKSRKCINALTVENRFVPAIAYLEWCGVKLDVEKWKKKMQDDKDEYDSYIRQLDDYVRSNTKLNTEFVASYTQGSLFEDVSISVPEVTVKWTSSQQVRDVVQKLGFSTKTIDKKKKTERDSVMENVLSTQKGIDDKFLELYFGFKGAEKNVTSYGQQHLNLINPNTGRLHTIFKQFGTVTGRMSSGSGEPNRDLALMKHLFAKDVRYVNLQNLPSKENYGAQCRSCFIAEEGNLFLSCDYSAEESRVQADVWNEKSLLDAFMHGIDTHNLYAKLCFPEELKDIDVKDVKKFHPELRQKAKSAEFAVSYGSDGTSIAANIGMDAEKARDMVSNLLKGMPGMAEFKKQAIRFVAKNGYIVINETTGHRVYWPEWAEWKAESDRMDENFMREYALVHKGTGDAVCEMVRRHNAKSHAWFTKNVLNYPIQGGSAIVLKQAAADLFEWVVKHGYFGTILFCVFVHDEIDCECPKTIAKPFGKVMQDIMQKASAKYYKKLPIPAECSIGDHWIH